MNFLRPKVPRFFTFALVVSVLGLFIELALRQPAGGRSGDPGGVAFGLAAALLIASSAALTLRKSFKRISALGPTRSWLQLHVYGGWLGVLFALLHAGFEWPHGALNWLLWLVTIWVGFSGLVGVLLQKWIPTTLASGLRVTVIFERIEGHVQALLNEADALTHTASGPVQTFYQKEIRPFLTEVRPRLTFALDITGGFSQRLKLFEHVSSLLSGQDRALVDDLRTIVQEKNELDAQYSLQRLLRQWLVWHIAPAWLLICLIFSHLYVVWLY